jgi:hypothetical protein
MRDASRGYVPMLLSAAPSNFLYDKKTLKFGQQLEFHTLAGSTGYVAYLVALTPTYFLI